MTIPVHRDPLSAWNYLCEHGGIEIEGRDEGLDQRILQRLDPTAPSLDRALAKATMTAFTRAFFEAIHPFVAMFQDILRFFERADATIGKEQWTLRLDDIDLDLSHFQKWLASWHGLGRAEMQIPAVDWQGVWRLFAVLLAKSQIRTEIERSVNEERHDLPQDVQAWVDAHNGGEYLPLPSSLVPPRCPPELRVSASIAQMALVRLRELGLTRDKLMNLYRHRLMDPHRHNRGEMDRSDALDFWSIAQNETDYWLRSYVVALSAAATHLTESVLLDLGRDLDAITSEFPLRPFNVEVSVTELESVLSLPIWQKRYELYSVWVVTEMVRALQGHQVELHHDHGRIAFAFHETLVATIHSSPGPFKIISERRSPLQNPRGEGRTASVQPDHAIWTKQYGQEVCRMVVEVKHYKRSAKRTFLDVFEDYARAFPEGQIYLVNYGPAGNAVHDVSRGISDRCHAVEQLTPGGIEAREEFAKAVRACVGEPILSWPSPLGGSTSTVLVIDVSASMWGTLHSDTVGTLVRDVVAVECPRELVAIDSSIIGSWPVSIEGFAELVNAGGGSTALAGPVNDLLGSTKRVVIITDRDGLSTLSGVHVARHHCEAQAPEGVLVRVCTVVPRDHEGDYQTIV